jgi:phosphoglycolate phosphatase
MEPQLLIFDLDGTLIDSRADLTSGINYMRAQYSLGPLSVPTVSGYIGDGVRKLVERSLQGAEVDCDEALLLMKEFYFSHATVDTTLYDGVREGVEILHQAGHRLALLTNKPAEPTRIILDHFGLTGFFVEIIGGGDLPNMKPEPDGIYHCMVSTGLGKGSTWMIGDHCADLGAAAQAGVQGAFVSYGFGEERGHKPDAYFASFPELVGYFV